MLGRNDRNHRPEDESTVTEQGPSTAFEKLRLKRRALLATVGSAIVVPTVATREVSATDHGYGAGAYGGGSYGDPSTTGGDEPTTAPRITRLDAADTSNPRNPHADVSIEWETSIADGTLGSAELTVLDSTGEVLSWNYDLSGQSVTESESRRIKHGGSVTYTVELTVSSTHGTNESAQTTFDAP